MSDGSVNLSPSEFSLQLATIPNISRQIKHDCEFLEAEGIMDYSLLLGIHVETSHQGASSGFSGHLSERMD